MADGGVWARLPQPNNGGGIWTKTSSGWVEIGGGGGSDGVEGLGGWAVISAVSGSPKRYSYTADGTAWVAFEWLTGGGSVTTTAGLVEALLVGGGARGATGTGGGVIDSVLVVGDGTSTVTVGIGGGGTPPSADWTIFGKPSQLTGPHGSVASGAGIHMGGVPSVGGAYGGPHMSAITGGPARAYSGQQGEPGVRWEDGTGAASNGTHNGHNGSVILRLPAEQTAGVSSSTWVTRIDYYAEVTDGIVTDTYQERFYGDDTVRTENGSYASPEQPDDLIPCDPSVAEGWTYADGEFTPPPPDPSWREEAIEALKQQLKDLQKDQA